MLYLDKNDLTGDTGDICVDGVGPENLSSFITDCNAVICPSLCCECCPDDDPRCNDGELMVSFDSGYVRNQYIFSEDLTFDISIVSNSSD
jgi:hypothetical protein